MKTIHVNTDSKLSNIDQVSALLPTNYMVTGMHYDASRQSYALVVTGDDNAGWTAEGYVIPRLASGLYVAKVIS